MSRRILVIAWFAYSVILAGRAQCFPQEPSQSERTIDTGASKASEEKGNSEANKTDDQPENSVTLPRTVKEFGERFLLDQKAILTSPAKLQASDTIWLLPLGGFTSMLFVTDAQFSRHLSNNPTTISHYKTLSDAGVGALVGGAGALWLMSYPTHNSHWRETGFLSGEAAINALLEVEALKYSLRRESPYQGNGNGDFFQSGGKSFPSEHAAVAFSVAGVIAHEYPGPVPKILAYGLATAVAISRVKAKQHFNSDVLVGSVMGEMISQNVYSRHFDPELGGSEWHSMSAIAHELSHSTPRLPASPFVPLDSWIYPAITRLAAEGYIDVAFMGTRPWTRIECARLTELAADKIADLDANSEPARIYGSLYMEFRHDFEALEAGSEHLAKLDSVYSISTQVVGAPLDDSRHFGQTIINNDGRPYGQGFNNDTGLSAWAAEDRYVINFQGEYQHAPGAPAYSQSVQDLLDELDGNPAQKAAPVPSTDQFRLLDTYVGTAISGWNFTFGKQSLWWGQGVGGALLFSDNAEPIYMFRASRIEPFILPWIFRYLGPMKLDFFMGKLSGNEFPPRPVMHGEQITFKPTRNLELVFARLAEFGGAPVPGVTYNPPPTQGCPFGLGRPITLKAIVESYISFEASNAYACSENPGKRTGGFEFSYRIPFVRNWLTVYTDSITPDDPSPIDAPRRAAVNPGIYLTHFPKISRLDLRVEGVSTNTPSSSNHGEYVYYDNFYHDASTNKGDIVGSWIGRQGVGLQAWSTYWFSPRSSLQFGYRHGKIACDFIPGGGTQNDAFTEANWWVHKNLNLSVSVQYEKWLVPLLQPAPQTNWTSTIGITFHPGSAGLPFAFARQGQNSGAVPGMIGSQP
jgi:membrane-associated phospholipid phosphatase